MSITYTWKINSLKVKDLNDSKPKAIVQTYWSVTGKNENGDEGTFSGATPFTVDPNDACGPFIPFDELTEEDVINWIKTVVNKDIGYKNHIDEQIIKQINERKNPIIEAKLPWVKEDLPPNDQTQIL
jgi:hypothetical protein